MIDKHNQLAKTIKCPSCRTSVNIDEISYVSESADQSESIPVKGSWGTKIEAVVRKIKVLREKDPTTKSLIFSQWNDVLLLISRALEQNNLKYARVFGKTKIEKALQPFKEDADVCALLLPVATGNNGLNLVEATHVFLVEPLLNPAQEAQAINRVHRIGQNNVTYVHRFIIRGTIEERVSVIAKQKAEKSSHSDFWKMQVKSEKDLLTVNDMFHLFADG